MDQATRLCTLPEFSQLKDYLFVCMRGLNMRVIVGFILEMFGSGMFMKEAVVQSLLAWHFCISAD